MRDSYFISFWRSLDLILTLRHRAPATVAQATRCWRLRLAVGDAAMLVGMGGNVCRETVK